MGAVPGGHGNDLIEQACYPREVRGGARESSLQFDERDGGGLALLGHGADKQVGERDSSRAREVAAVDAGGSGARDLK